MAKKNMPRVVFWSLPGKDRFDSALSMPQDKPAEMAFREEGGFYAGRMEVPAAGTLVMNIVSPRPFRLWFAGCLVLDEGLFWRLYERKIVAAVVFPWGRGELPFMVEAGPRSTWLPWIDTDCPSRNRDHVRSELRRRLPDRLDMSVSLEEDVCVPAVGLKFPTSQFLKDGVVWQHLIARPAPGFSSSTPSLYHWSPAEEPEDPLFLSSSILPCNAVDASTPEERRRGVRHFHIPVANPLDQPRPLRKTGAPEKRIEPTIEVARTISLTVEGDRGSVSLDMPAYESVGRNAPRREYRKLEWPSFAQARPRLPEPVLPESLVRFEKIYWAAWEMLYSIVRDPGEHSGLPNAYIATASRNFPYHQFVWDSSFTAMCTAYGWKALHPYATLDLLYSRQFDGGYIHREHDVRDGLPTAYEPDFSPNPPIMSVAEWAIAGITGDRLRLAKVYRPLCDMHRWLQMNRRLPDGTYWTTGLANGLDNSPSLGDGYPCLTAQMAHEAEILGKMARELGLDSEAKKWEGEHSETGKALNSRLWSRKQEIYATSLPGGGHNTNKVVTAFWPLWAGVVPPARVEALAAHLKDPKSFWRHHPIPSLAADSPFFRPPGDYWRGSTWAPTNFAAIKGFDRAGRHDLAVETTIRHLDCMLDVLESTGHIWENYCSEESKRGSWSGPDYCWSSLGPIALLLEVLLGFHPEALSGTLRWRLPETPGCGIRRLPMGQATISVVHSRDGEGREWIDVDTDRRFKLCVVSGKGESSFDCAPGHSRFAAGK